jgi:peroxiredoxin/Tfp pilus assembly protein PilF
MNLRTVAALLAFVPLLVPGRAAALMSLRPGDAPPSFTLPDLAGNQVGSEALAGAPSVILFWSTWSPRSGEMFDDFKRHAAAYAGKGLKIVAINIDGENLGAAQKAAIREYATARELPFPVLLDESLRTFSSWGVMAHPTEVVLDAGGRIAYVLPGYPLSLREELEDAIKKALGISAAPQGGGATSAGSVPQGMALQHYNLGRQLLEKGDHEKALEAFRRAADADPAFLEAGIMIARVSLAFGDLAAAERLARQVSPEAINRGDLRYLLGNLMLAKGEKDAAESAFRGLRERFPKEGWGEWGLGQVSLARGDHAGALVQFTSARALQAANIEGESSVRRHFRDRWMRRETVPEEEGFIAAFPSLGEVRERYRKLFGAAGSTAPAAP